MGVMLIEIILIMISITKILHHALMLVILLEFLSLVLLKTVSFNSIASLNMICVYLMMIMMVSEASLGMALITMIARSSSLNTAII